MASPRALTRAPTTTRDADDRRAAGVMAMLSSSVKVSGRSLTCLRRIASGMRGPSAARAKTNKVSSGRALAASFASRLTVPLTDAAAVAVAAVPGGGCGAAACVPVGAALPESLRASSMPPWICCANSLLGSSCTIFSQWRIAPAKSLLLNAIVPASDSALRLFGSSASALAISRLGSPSRLRPLAMASASA